MGGQHHGLAVVASQAHDPVLDHSRRLHVEADRGFVEEQDRRVGDQRRGHSDLLPHTAREAAHLALAHLPQAQTKPVSARNQPVSSHPWDVAAGVVLAQEAGAIIVDLDGSPYSTSSFATLAATLQLSQPLLELITTALKGTDMYMRS